jgi:hypothetical protein
VLLMTVDKLVRVLMTLKAAASNLWLQSKPHDGII